MRLFFLASLFSIFYLLFSVPGAFAAPVSLSVSPAIFEIETEPLDEVKTRLQVSNETTEILPLQIKLIPFQPKKDSGEVEFLNIDLPIKDFVSIEDNNMPIKDLVLQPQESRSLTLHLFIPRDEKPGDYYFSIIFLSKESPEPEPIKIKEGELRAYSNILGGVAANVLLAIKEKSEEPAQFMTAEFSTAKLLQGGPAIFNLKIKNEGRHFVKPEGKIILTNILGQKTVLELPSRNILAGASRLYPPISSFNIFLLGPYSAELELDPPTNPTRIIFYAFPIKHFLLGVLIIIALLKFKKRVKTKASR